jgi:DNA polymerase-3 subunit epsilon
VKLTVEAFPRLSLVRRVLDDGGCYLGPFGSRRTAELAVAAVHEAIPLRQCSGRVSPTRAGPACVLAQMGRCGAPCQSADGLGEDVEAYASHAEAFRRAVGSDPRAVVEALTARLRALADDERYEDAASCRDRLTAFVRAAARLQRICALTAVSQLVAARPTADLGWELAVVRRGRLVAAGTVPRGAHPGRYVEALVASAETVLPEPGPLPAATAEEVECVLRWLERDGTRLVRLDGVLASPARGAGGHRGWLEAAQEARGAVRPFDDGRGLRPVARPARASA